MNEKTEPIFEGFAVVELFGHNQIAGYCQEVPFAGTSMLRVDVPEIGGNPGYTKFFGGSAIYAITPVTEETVVQAAKRLDVRPVQSWIVPDREATKPQLPGEMDDYDDRDDYEHRYDDEIEF